MNRLKHFWHWLCNDMEANFHAAFRISDWQFTFAAGGIEACNWENYLLFLEVRNTDEDTEDGLFSEGRALLGYFVTCDEVTFHLLYFRFTYNRCDW